MNACRRSEGEAIPYQKCHNTHKSVNFVFLKKKISFVFLGSVSVLRVFFFGRGIRVFLSFFSLPACASSRVFSPLFVSRIRPQFFPKVGVVAQISSFFLPAT